MQRLAIYLLCVFGMIVSCQKEESAQTTDEEISLEDGFKSPPNEAKARTWWHWISGNVSKSGITKDLEP